MNRDQKRPRGADRYSAENAQFLPCDGWSSARKDCSTMILARNRGPTSP